MSTVSESDRTSAVGTVPGAAIIRRIRRLLFVSVGSAAVYSVFTVASKGGCLGGVTDAGGFIDSNGDPSDVAPTCVQMTLGPSPLVYVAFAVIVLLAIGRVLTRADGEATAIRILDRASLGIMAAAAVSVVVSQIWFGLIPLDGIDGSGAYIWPFPFASVDLQTDPMNAP